MKEEERGTESTGISYWSIARTFLTDAPVRSTVLLLWVATLVAGGAGFIRAVAHSLDGNWAWLAIPTAIFAGEIVAVLLIESSAAMFRRLFSKELALAEHLRLAAEERELRRSAERSATNAVRTHLDSITSKQRE